MSGQFHSIKVNSSTGEARDVTNASPVSAPEPEAPKVSALGRVRVQMGADGQATIENLTGTTAAKADNRPAGGSGLDRARTSAGYPVSRGDLKPDTMIPYKNGDASPLAVLVNMGFVRQSAAGVWEVTPEGAPYLGSDPSFKSAAPAPVQDAAAAKEGEPPEVTKKNDAEALDAPVEFKFSPESQAAIAQVGERVGEPTREALVSALITGKATDRLLGDVAQALGQEVAETRTAIDTVVAELTPMAMKAVGMDADEFSEFTDWIWQRHPEQAQKAVSDVSDFRTGKLKALAAEFTSEPGRYSFEEIAAAKFFDRDGNRVHLGTRQVGSHTVLVINGKEVALRDVVKKISRTTKEV